jgi:PAS domain S-box-containing protein
MAEQSEYILEPLREAADFTLYRGRERGNQMPILALAVAAEQPSPQSFRRLEHEYSLATELDAAWAAQPLALTRQQGRPVLLLKDPGGEPLDRVIEQHQEQPIDLNRFLRIAIGLAGALSQTHRQGLIHKDVKPANALVDDSGHVWLTGFGIASQLLRERQTPAPPEIIAGTFAYMSPEQTGRMNRSIDSRSDLYSLGVTLYHMLTGVLPFIAADPLEWFHCHIARQPIAPVDRRSVPEQLSAIVMKLLAKNAEERYQTAAGLKADLRRCLVEWQSHGRIAPFPLGADDSSDRLLIPEKLYGREREVDSLIAAFDRVVAGGRPELVLVSGYSGVGKSAVVNELHKWLVPTRSLFASGKFDQYKRDIPYATVARAFQSLIHPLLSKPETELTKWRDDLNQALNPNGSLLVDIVPELRLIIGEQSPVAALPAQEARARSHLAFRRFIGVFARPEHPLALFLDDLQWLDAATLDLLEDLLVQQDLAQLLVVGAYRDNEVDSTHPLMRKLSAIRQTKATVQEIVLTPLGSDDLSHLISDALHCELHAATSLAQLIHGKTDGNPFFAIQFIHALVDEGLVTFEHENAQWRWDLDAIRAKGYTDNVVDLMVAKLNRLPESTQKALQQFACVGNSAEAATLSAVLEASEQEVEAELWEALQQELIVHSEDSWQFVHDRVREAAYSTIAAELRAEDHLRIGRLLNAHTPAEKREEAIFEIVNQLNRGAKLLTSEDERYQLAELNLIAGKRAKASTAYSSALIYLLAGAEVLTDECWERRHDLIFQLELNRAECEFLTGELAAAEKRLTMLSSRAANTVERAAVECLHIDLYTVLERPDRAVSGCLDFLRYLGVDWLPHPTEEQIRSEYDRIWSQLGSRGIEEIIDFPLMSDPASIATLDVLTKVYPAALFTDKNLVAMVICRAISLSIERGNSDGSCVAYVYFAKIAGPRFGDYKTGFRFGQLGYELVEKRGMKRFQARTCLWFAEFVLPWTRRFQAGRGLTQRALEIATKVGDLTIVAYSHYNLNTNFLAAGDLLAEAQRQAEIGLEAVERMHFGHLIDVIATQLGLIRTLRGLTYKFGSFDDGQLSEAMLEQHLTANPAATLPECWYWIRKLQALFFAGDYSSALDAAARARPILWTSAAMFETAEYHFYAGLSHAASCAFAVSNQDGSISSRPGEVVLSSSYQRECQQHFEALVTHHRQLEVWAEHCPENFGNRAALIAAEIARIEGRTLDAEQLYEDAIRSAQANGFVHNEALANELAAGFYRARGLEKIANAYLKDARALYSRWGADGKVKQLDESYPRLREVRTLAAPATIGPPVGQLDVETVVKASQALSSEMVLPRLIEKLMRIAVEHAGAERGLLILIRGSEPWIEAEATSGPGRFEVAVRQAAVTPSDLPPSMLHYVIRTQEGVLLDDASVDNVYSTDEYVRLKRSRSVLCLPIVKQMKLVGALYLENNLTPHAFTSDRVGVLQLLASQAAISLENAALYTDLQRSEAFLAHGQRISHTGSFRRSTFSDEIYLSEEAYEIYGLDRSVTPNLQWLVSRIHPEDRTRVQQTIEYATHQRTGFDVEYRLLRRDDSIRYLHVAVQALEHASGELEFVGAVTDITERKEAEEALRLAQGDLERINRVTTMGELAASLAHEIKQPISGAITNANVCLRKLGSDEPNLDEVRGVVIRIVRDAQRAAEIIDKIRSQFEKSSENRAVLDVNEIIRETFALLRSEAVRYNISVRTDLAADLPQIAGDRVQLQQVAMNIIVNSIEAMKDVDGIREMVIESKRGEEEQILVTVSDTGPGFPPHLAEKIFDPFFTTKPHGTGMGLRISRSIIQSHGGRLWAIASSGRGATFHFSLPAATPDHG